MTNIHGLGRRWHMWNTYVDLFCNMSRIQKKHRWYLGLALHISLTFIISNTLFIGSIINWYILLVLNIASCLPMVCLCYMFCLMLIAPQQTPCGSPSNTRQPSSAHWARQQRQLESDSAAGEANQEMPKGRHHIFTPRGAPQGNRQGNILPL